MRQVSDDLQPATAQRSPRPTVSVSGWARRQWSGLHPVGLMADRKLQEAGQSDGDCLEQEGGKQHKNFAMLVARQGCWSALPATVY